MEGADNIKVKLIIHFLCSNISANGIDLSEDRERVRAEEKKNKISAECLNMIVATILP